MKKIDINIHREEIELLVSQKASQKNIAKQFGVDPSTISKWLKKWDGRSNVIRTLCQTMYDRYKNEGETKEDMEKTVNRLWEKPENRKCYYSNIELTSENGFFNTFSTERLDESKKSYLAEGNTVLICRLFQSGSNPVGLETEKTIITKKMKDQILNSPDSIKRISNNRGQEFEDGMIYKIVTRFNINFDDTVEVETEMNFLPRGMRYDKTNKQFVVTTKNGEIKRFGPKTHETKAGRFQKAMEFYKNEYYDNLNVFVDYYVNHNGHNHKILICPRTKFMTIIKQEFEIYKLYSSLPECNPGKPQWKKKKFDDVPKLSKRVDSIERIKFIESRIDECRDIVEAYRSNNKNDDRLKKHTRLTYYIDKIANRCSDKKLQKEKAGNYKEIFLAVYDKICANRLRCEYSNISMSLKQCYDWSLSIERLDNKIGYTRENISLVCAEFNTREQWEIEHFKKYWPDSFNI
jgi:predicted transcriptional regulator